MNESAKTQPPTVLLSGHLAILRKLWRCLYDPPEKGHRDIGLSREALWSALTGVTDEITGKPLFATPASLYKQLTRLALLPSMVTVEKGPAAGAKSAGQGHYRDIYLLADGKVVAWPETAVIAMAVWDAPGHNVNQTEIVERLLAQKLQRHARLDGTMSREEILEDIRFLADRGYIDFYGETIRAIAGRMRFERHYVSWVADQYGSKNGASRSALPPQTSKE